MFYFYFYYFFKKGLDPLPPEILEKAELPRLVIIGIALAALIILFANAALVAWFIFRKRSKGIIKKKSQFNFFFNY